MNIRSYFPLNAKVIAKDAHSLIPVLILYLIVCAIAGVVSWVLGWIPVLGWVLRILCWLIGVYCLVGIILAIVDCVQ